MAQKAKKQGKSKNGNKTHGRNKDWCKAYAGRGQRDKNKRKVIARHLKANPTDASALASAKALGMIR